MVKTIFWVQQTTSSVMMATPMMATAVAVPVRPCDVVMASLIQTVLTMSYEMQMMNSVMQEKITGCLQAFVPAPAKVQAIAVCCAENTARIRWVAEPVHMLSIYL